MKETSNKKSIIEFALSTLSINNRKTVYLILAILLIGGITAYLNMARESFPEIQVPEIYVNVPYPGNSPEIIKDKVIKPFEKELNTIKGIDKIKSTAIQDFGIIVITFDFSVSPKEAKDLVEEALNDARTTKQFAQDLPVEPSVNSMDFAAFPILNINLSGNYSVQFLKDKAELIKDKLEALAEVSAVDIRGVQDQKLKIEMRKYDAEAKRINYQDVENAIRNDNLTMGAGNLSVDGIDHFVIIDGKFRDLDKLRNMVVKHEEGDDVYLYEVADVSFGDTDTTSYARQGGSSVVMIDVKKRSGANIIESIDKIKEEMAIIEKVSLPEGVDVTFSNDQSVQIRSQISNLENSIIMGVLLVVIVLLFFMGLRNALFVGVAIPLSMFMSFMILQSAGVSLNIMVLFSLVLALGMLVDNGIVVVENIYRLMEKEGLNSFQAAIQGVGEVAWPIIASTATTLAVFVPLALWPGMMGQFMQYLPITLMIVLGSSLFVALVINPVLTAVLMKVEQKSTSKKKVYILFAVFIILSLPGYLSGGIAFGNLMMTMAILTLVNTFVFEPATFKFQNVLLPKLERAYHKFLAYVIAGKRPIGIFFGTFGVLIFSFVLFAVFPPKVVFFPDGDPNYLNIFIEHPAGTEISVTNQTAKDVKSVIDGVLNRKRTGTVNGVETVYAFNDIYDVAKIKAADGTVTYDTIPLVASFIEQVGKGTADPMEGPSFGETPHKARLTIFFTEFEHREGISTGDVMTAIEDTLKGWSYADVKIVIAKNPAGPPMEPPVNIEITGADNYKNIVVGADLVRKYLQDKNVQGAQKLAADVRLNKAEINIVLDREYLRSNGMSTGQIASTIRTSLFGKDISTYDIEDDSYDVNLRLGREFRGGIDDLLDQKIMFMNNRGVKLNIPIRSVVKDVQINYNNSSIKRKNVENVVTVFSGVEQGANANEIVDEMKVHMESFAGTPEGQQFAELGLEFRFSGQMEEQAKEMEFLSGALAIAIGLILVIIVTQFNSFSTPIIILLSVILSLAGVFMGIVILRDEFVIIMTMIGIISLAGIVVNNAIVLIDYTNLIRTNMREEQGLDEMQQLSIEEVKTAIIQGGETRLRPVLLTAITTILGLLPLAVGLNINFFSLYSDFDPQISFGGDNAMMFGAMSRAIIYGLTFATFLTLVAVPVMYYLLYRLKIWIYRVMNMELKSNI